MKLLERITVEQDKCGGHPCIRGLRIRVTDVFGMLTEGMPPEKILHDFLSIGGRVPREIKRHHPHSSRKSFKLSPC